MNALTPGPSPKLGEGRKTRKRQQLLPPFSPSGRRGWEMRGIEGMTLKSTVKDDTE
jgi:hypothetical protein